MTFFLPPPILSGRSLATSKREIGERQSHDAVKPVVGVKRAAEDVSGFSGPYKRVRPGSPSASTLRLNVQDKGGMS